MSEERFYTKCTLIHDILSTQDGGASLSGKRATVGGWVKTGRQQGKGTFAFLELNDGSCLASLQIIVSSAVAEQAGFDLAKLVLTGTSITVSGTLTTPPEGTKQKIELRAEEVTAVGFIDKDEYPLPKSKMSLEKLRDYPHLRVRTNTISAIIRIRDELSFATATFFRSKKIRHVHTPIITTSDCEGAGEMFQVTTLINQTEKTVPNKDGKIDYTKDFFARQAFLTVSGQLHAETLACGLGRVYTFGPTFRAENSHTSRHLAEFWMVEPELAFADLQYVMDCAEDYVKFMCKWLLDHCVEDLEFMVKNFDKNAIDRLTMVAETTFMRITYTEAVELLEKVTDKEFENKVEWGIDLASEHERYLTEVIYKKPVIVYDYPKGIKAFYMRLNDDAETVAAMDVLVPKVGELVGGSQREERYDVMVQRMTEMGLPLEAYKEYLDLRRYGTVKHSGFGLGFERMLLFATGMDNIRDVIPYPRTPGKAVL